MKKILPDGTLIWGIVPKDDEKQQILLRGYEATDDPHIFVLTMPECGHRDYETIKKDCCGTVKLIFCNLLLERTTRQRCHGCKMCG